MEEKTQTARRFRSLKGSLIVAFTSVSVVILVVTGSLELYFNVNVLNQVTSNQQQLVAQEAAGTVRSYLQEKFRILETGVDLGSLATSSQDQQQLMADKLLGLEPAFRQVVLLDGKDKELVRVSRLSQVASTLLFNQLTPSVLASIRANKEYIGSAYIDNMNNEPMVIMAVPSTDVFGNYQGALVAEVNLKFMWDLVDKIKVGQGGQAYVVDKKGDLIAYADVSRVLAGENVGRLEGVKGFISGEKKKTSGLVNISKGILGTLVVAEYVALDTPDWAVVVELPALEAYKAIIQVIGLLVLVTVLGFAAAIVPGAMLADRISGPIIRLKDSALEISRGKFETRIAIESDNEIGQLANSFNQMAEKLQDLYASLEEKVKEKTAELVDKVEELEASKKAVLNLLDDSKRLEEELLVERDRAKAIISSMGEGLVVIDRDGKIILVNPTAEKLLAINASEAIGESWVDLTRAYKGGTEVPADQRTAVQVFQSGEVMTMDIADDYYYLAKNGRKLPVASITAPLVTDKIIGAVIVFRDVSVLKQLDEAKTSFISVASHQLRTPLTSMRWFAEMLLSGDAGQISEEQKHFVDRIYQGTDRMIALVNLLLQLARVEAGRVRIQPVPVDLKATTQGVVLTLKASLEQRGQTVRVESDPDPFPVIPMDQEVIWQVIQNLLTNANRYSPEKATIFVRIGEKGDFAQYSVTDTGIGIPKAQQARIFDKFFRADNALKMAPEGTGLGLSLVKILVGGWGGKVWFESEENQGTTFSFTVPLAGMKQKEGEVTLAV